MLHKILEGTGFVMFLIGVMAVGGNPWYVPIGFMLIGAFLLLWGSWEEGLLQRWIRERRRRKWSHRR